MNNVRLNGAHGTREIQAHCVIRNGNLFLLEIEDRRSFFKKAIDIIKALFKGINAIALQQLRKITAKSLHFPSAIQRGEMYSYEASQLPWRDASASGGLYLFIHGLRGSPLDWSNYIKEVKHKDPQGHLFVPYVPQKGNCPLETAASPLLKVVEDYLAKFPGKPITIIGTSNGGRIATYIESHLEASILQDSPLSIVSIAGVHYGTKLINYIQKIGLSFLLALNSTLEKEFSYGSQAAIENLSLWQQKQQIWKENHQFVRHLFCATTEDEQVRDVASSLPYVEGALVEYKIFSGQSHISILDAACKDVCQWIGQRD